MKNFKETTDNNRNANLRRRNMLNQANSMRNKLAMEQVYKPSDNRDCWNTMCIIFPQENSAIHADDKIPSSDID
uniref:Uncharacterized protein n=1 Tax=Acrobeloides nanus TaxID=290746 RepID=A0A914E5G7_9BILA